MSLDTWQDFLTETRKKKKKKKTRSRKSGAGLERSFKWFLDKGPQKKGGYPKKRRANLKKKKFNDISAPPGAPGGLEEEIEEESFEMQDELQPEIWQDEALWPEIRERMIEIVEDFLDGLNVSVSVTDIRLTGSLANYNWSKYSDVDLHIVVDFDKIDEDTSLVKSFFDAARMRWNDLHDIKLYGFEVELYVENIRDPHHSSGVYSVLKKKWIKHPARGDIEIDFVTARKKSDDISTRVNLTNYMVETGKHAAALKSIKHIKEKIRRMRRAGLESPEREFSPENVAFKILRRDGTLEKLSNMKFDAYDKLMSMTEDIK
jgi:predicted nucleotidyltransferase